MRVGSCIEYSPVSGATWATIEAVGYVHFWLERNDIFIASCPRAIGIASTSLVSPSFFSTFSVHSALVGNLRGRIVGSTGE